MRRDHCKPFCQQAGAGENCAHSSDLNCRQPTWIVMAGLVQAVHTLSSHGILNVDARNGRGDDDPGRLPGNSGRNYARNFHRRPPADRTVCSDRGASGSPLIVGSCAHGGGSSCRCHGFRRPRHRAARRHQRSHARPSRTTWVRRCATYPPTTQADRGSRLCGAQSRSRPRTFSNTIFMMVAVSIYMEAPADEFLILDIMHRPAAAAEQELSGRQERRRRGHGGGAIRGIKYLPNIRPAPARATRAMTLLDDFLEEVEAFGGEHQQSPTRDHRAHLHPLHPQLAQLLSGAKLGFLRSEGYTYAPVNRKTPPGRLAGVEVMIGRTGEYHPPVAALPMRFLLGDGASGDGASDVDQIVCDDTEADPAFHAVIAFVAAAGKGRLPALYNTDASLAAGAPFLTVSEPALFCSRLRSALLVERLGMQTRLTPLALQRPRPACAAFTLRLRSRSLAPALARRSW